MNREIKMKILKYCLIITGFSACDLRSAEAAPETTQIEVQDKIIEICFRGGSTPKQDVEEVRNIFEQNADPAGSLDPDIGFDQANHALIRPLYTITPRVSIPTKRKVKQRTKKHKIKTDQVKSRLQFNALWQVAVFCGKTELAELLVGQKVNKRNSIASCSVLLREHLMCQVFLYQSRPLLDLLVHLGFDLTSSPYSQSFLKRYISHDAQELISSSSGKQLTWSDMAQKVTRENWKKSQEEQMLCWGIPLPARYSQEEAKAIATRIKLLEDTQRKVRDLQLQKQRQSSSVAVKTLGK
jgi:hypothetical protein